MDDGLNKQITSDQSLLTQKEKSEQIYCEVHHQLKTTRQKEDETQMASLGNPTKHLKKNNTHPPQTLPEQKEEP